MGRGLIIVAISVLLMAACGGGSDGEAAEPEQTSAAGGAAAAVGSTSTGGSAGEMAMGGSGAGQGAAPVSCLDDPNAGLSSVWICVSGMTWSACVASVEAAVGSVECVKSADVASYDGLTVEYYTDHTTTDEIVAAIESVNGGQFTVTCLQPS